MHRTRERRVHCIEMDLMLPVRLMHGYKGAANVSRRVPEEFYADLEPRKGTAARAVHT